MHQQNGKTYPATAKALAIMVAAQAMADVRERRYQAEVIRWAASKEGRAVLDLAGISPVEVVMGRRG